MEHSTLVKVSFKAVILVKWVGCSHLNITMTETLMSLLRWQKQSGSFAKWNLASSPWPPCLVWHTISLSSMYLLSTAISVKE